MDQRCQTFLTDAARWHVLLDAYLTPLVEDAVRHHATAAGEALDSLMVSVILTILAHVSMISAVDDSCRAEGLQACSMLQLTGVLQHKSFAAGLDLEPGNAAGNFCGVNEHRKDNANWHSPPGRTVFPVPTRCVPLCECSGAHFKGLMAPGELQHLVTRARRPHTIEAATCGWGRPAGRTFLYACIIHEDGSAGFTELFNKTPFETACPCCAGAIDHHPLLVPKRVTIGGSSSAQRKVSFPSARLECSESSADAVAWLCAHSRALQKR